MSRKPKVSIIMPSYNREDLIAEAIESCLNQTFKNFELIIVDDCSKDNSHKIAKEYESKDSRVKVIANAQNKKLPKTLNIGFKEAKGEYFTWSSDDNLYNEDAIQRMVDILDGNKNIGLVYADYTHINEDGVIGSRIFQEDPEYLPIRDCVGACFMYRKDVASKVGNYNEDMFLIEDYEYWLRMGLKTKLYHIPESMYYYRTHKGSLTQTRKEEIRQAKLRLKEGFAGKYKIPSHLKPIDEMYKWFIGDRGFLSYLKLIKILLQYPFATSRYILANIRRMNLKDILFREKS